MPYKDPIKRQEVKNTWWKRNKEYYHDRYMANRDEILAQQKIDYANMNIEERNKLRVATYKSHLKRRYNLTPDEYMNLLISQNGGCAICPKTELENNGRLAVDHDHKTKKVRGLLCRTCNVALGAWENNIELFYKALEYLKRNS